MQILKQPQTFLTSFDVCLVLLVTPAHLHRSVRAEYSTTHILGRCSSTTHAVVANLHSVFDIEETAWSHITKTCCNETDRRAAEQRCYVSADHNPDALPCHE